MSLQNQPLSELSAAIGHLDEACKKILLFHLGSQVLSELKERKIISSFDKTISIINRWMEGTIDLPLDIHFGFQAIVTRYRTDITQVLPLIGKILPDLLQFDNLVSSYKKLNELVKKYENRLYVHHEDGFHFLLPEEGVDCSQEQFLRLLSLYKFRLIGN